MELWDFQFQPHAVEPGRLCKQRPVTTTPRDCIRLRMAAEPVNDVGSGDLLLDPTKERAALRDAGTRGFEERGGRTRAPRLIAGRAGQPRPGHTFAARVYMRSILVAMMKSFSCSPLIFLVCRETPPGSARIESFLVDCKIRFMRACQAAFITAPSITTPRVAYFHSAISSFRANATMVVLLRRPPLRMTRSLNHKATSWRKRSVFAEARLLAGDALVHWSMGYLS